MSTVHVAFQMLLQGTYSLLWIAVLFDAASPSLDLRNIPDLTGGQQVLAFAVLFTIAYAIGVIVHTLQRSLFKPLKDRWSADVLMSESVRERFRVLQVDRFLEQTGSPTMAQLESASGFERRRLAGAIVQSADYLVMTTHPQMFAGIQVYRDQYRIARGFILPSVALGIVLPLWEPVESPLIAIQLFLLGLLAASIGYIAYRERAYRYNAARLRAMAAVMNERRRQ